MTRILLAVLAMLMLVSHTQAQTLVVGDKDSEGRTYLFDEPLEGVYSNSWSGMRVGGDGSGQTDVHIRSDGKTVFQGIMSINCESRSGYFWSSNEEEAKYSVPQDVVVNARRFFCTIPCPDPKAPGVSYASQDPSFCARALIRCKPGQTLFSDHCGCGCVEAEKESKAPEPPAAPEHDGSSRPGTNAPDHIVLTPTIINVGKWADGMAYDGKSLWVAESGQRTIARVNLPRGQVVKRFKVGRLPTDMVAAGDGHVFTLVATDGVIKRQTRHGRVGTLAKVAKCPEAMIADGLHLWALILPDCTSDSSRVIRVDSRTGKQAQSPVLGEWAQALAAHGSQIWVAHARWSALSIVDQRSLHSSQIKISGAEFWAITANSRYVFAGGRVDGTKDNGLVVMVDPIRRVEVNRANVPEMVMKIISDETQVVAIGEKGTIWVFSANNLKLQRSIKLSTGAFGVGSAMFHEDLLLVSSSTFRGEYGAVFVLGNWRP